MTLPIDTNIYATVAAESWREVNSAWRDYQSENPEDTSRTDFDDCETYLYVFANGSWTIDHAQYIASTNGCISAVPIALYNGPAELAEDIEANEDWDAFENAAQDGEL